MEYRGIQIAESVKLNKQAIKNSLDKLANALEKANYKATGIYKNSGVILEFQCEKGHSFTTRPSDLILKNCGCKKCKGTCPEQAKENFYKTVEIEGYKLLSEYKGNKKKVQLECPNGHLYSVKPNCFISAGNRCSKCAGVCPEQAKKEFIDLIEANGHSFHGEYTTVMKHVYVDFKCGHKPQKITPAQYKAGHKKGYSCRECAYIIVAEKNSQKNREEFPLLVEANGHVLLTPFGRSVDDKVLIDFKCGHEPNSIRPNDYRRGDRCPECGKINMAEKHSREARKEFIQLVEANGHVLLSEYKNNRTSVLIDFKCKHKPSKIRAGNYKKGAFCKKCRGICPEQAKEEFIELLDKNGHKWVKGVYVNNRTEVCIDFNCEHGLSWVAPHNYKNGCWCKKCSESNGEKIIRERALEPMGIEFKQDYIFTGTRWRYDFYLPYEKIVIEVHGGQHYEDNAFFKKRTLKEEQKNDREKRQYAKKLGFDYIEVNYREHVPELALERFLNQFNQIKAKQLSLF